MRIRQLQVAVILAVSALAQGCATSEKISAIQMGDDNLSCTQLKEEFAKLDKAKSDIESKKGITGTNVASALFWLPGLAYTYYDAGEATRLIYERRSNLTAIANKKNCSV